MILLKFATAIKGDSQLDGHTEEITCDSFQWGVGRAVSSSGVSTDRDTSNPSFSEVTFSKSTDISSAEIFAQAIGGKSLGTATVTFINTHEGKSQVYLVIELHEALVSSYSANSGGDRPSESFTLNFTKVDMKYTQFDGDKKVADVQKKWDLRKGASF